MSSGSFVDFPRLKQRDVKLRWFRDSFASNSVMNCPLKSGRFKVSLGTPVDMLARLDLISWPPISFPRTNSSDEIG